MSVVELPARDRLVAELDAVLRRVWSAHPPRALRPEEKFRDLGLPSGRQIALLSRIEDEFSIDWEVADPPIGALNTLGGIADLVIAFRTPASAATASVTPAEDVPTPSISRHRPEERQP